MIEALRMDRRFYYSTLAVLLFFLGHTSDISGQRLVFDVIHYDAQVEPDIMTKSVRGKVVLRISTRSLTADARVSEIELDSGQLIIDSVSEEKIPLKFTVADRHLKIVIPPSQKEIRNIAIAYHGTPRWGIRFFPEQAQVYTVFSTSQWMPCVDAPDDRATLRMQLILPREFTATANGRLLRTFPAGSSRKIVHEWLQDKPIPTYIFGFAAGRFVVTDDGPGQPRLRYMVSVGGNGGSNSAPVFTAEEVRRIFRETRNMIEFFENRSGVRYADHTYTQVLAAGGADQEMSSFTALRQTYGKEVLANERAVWLSAHELAHQWWGNMVTCRDWNHFWLNEGLATFMAAAFLEHRYGREEYLKEVETYRTNYEKVRAAGKDKSLVFPDWLNPTPEDRTLVYDKGAYVLHLLRQEIGDDAFWSGLRLYTRRYWIKSVTTPDFQTAMEEGSGKRLDTFFQKWVY